MSGDGMPRANEITPGSGRTEIAASYSITSPPFGQSVCPT